MATEITMWAPVLGDTVKAGDLFTIPNYPKPRRWWQLWKPRHSLGGTFVVMGVVGDKAVVRLKR